MRTRFREPIFVVAFGILGLCAVGISASTAVAQIAPAGKSQPPELQAAISKSNAYIELMNRTLRATQSWERYKSWVNIATGPTGRERYIDYGLYSLYDVRGELDKALAATVTAPQAPELDAAVRRYIEAYLVLAPIITQASGYYDRKDYKDDKAAEGRALHVKLVPAAEAYLKERATLNREMRSFKQDVDKRSLAAIDAAEGRKARWHVKNVMMIAEEVIELMPTNASPMVNMPVFEEVLARYAAAVREMDSYAQANPGQFSGFESQPRNLLGKLRDFREKLARSKGDARRGAGQDLTWIINDYNSMVTFSRMATQFSR